MSLFSLIFFSLCVFTHASNKKLTTQKSMPLVPQRKLSVLETPTNINSSPAAVQFFQENEFLLHLLKTGYRSEKGTYHPLTVIEVPSKTPKKLSSDYYFPKEVEVIKKNNQWVLQYELISKDSKILDLCPSKELNEEIVREVTRYYSGMKFCLSPKKFANQESKRCETEIQPILVKKIFGNGTITKSCGRLLAGVLLVFAYAFCGEVNELATCEQQARMHNFPQPNDELFPDNPTIMQVYELCVIPTVPNVNYGNDEPVLPRVIYTRHNIVPGSLRHEDKIMAQLDDSTVPIQHINEDQSTRRRKSEQTSTEFYHENLKKFKAMKQAFASQTGTEYKPKMLVPIEDMAFPLQKKTTYTYFNIHALWFNLVPLMDLINYRIRQLAIKHNRELSIYTRTFQTNLEGYDKKYIGNSKIVVPNIWSKIVHDIVKNFDTAVVIHNTPNLTARSRELCPKMNRVPCYFENWWQKEEQYFSKEEIQMGAEYAYCCEVTERIKKTFGIDINFRNTIVDLTYNTVDSDGNLAATINVATDEQEV